METKMRDFQDSKVLVREYHQALDAACGSEINAVIQRYTTSDYHWRGMHPFYEQHSADEVAEVFWKPLCQAFSSIQRRPDVFMAGLNDADDFQSEWVCSMGHLMGLFDKTWLGIPPTGKMAFLRYAEFNRVIDGKICETALFCDIISVMQQAGLNPLPLATGAFFITPGPLTHEGLMYGVQSCEEGNKTLALINQMVKELNGSSLHSEAEELARTWHEDMIWFGPAGIGATYTRDRYEQQHQGPFREGLDDIQFHGHICRLAEGNFGGFFGWANLTMLPSGGFMGLPSAKEHVEMRVVDIYRRDGDKLAENWIFIDLLHFLSMQGLGVLERMEKITSA
jgi:predicted ester cyclase